MQEAQSPKDEAIFEVTTERGRVPFKDFIMRLHQMNEFEQVPHLEALGVQSHLEGFPTRLEYEQIFRLRQKVRGAYLASVGDLPDIMQLLCQQNPLHRLVGIDAIHTVIINDRKSMPADFFANQDFFQALVANMIGEKNAVLQYAYCDLIGVIVRSTRDHVLDNLVENCMLPSAVIVVL